MIVKPSQWGNSIGIRLPKEIARKAGISTDTELDIDIISEGRVVLQRVQKQPTLADLVAGITPQNRHDEVSFGSAVGRESL